VKKYLKSVHIYRSYRQNKSGVSVFLEHPVLSLVGRSVLSIVSQLYLLGATVLCRAGYTLGFATLF